MSGPIGETFVGTADRLRKFINISEEIVEFSSDDLFDYKGSGYIGEGSDIVLFMMGIAAFKYQKSYTFTTPVSSSTSIIISGAPQAQQVFSANTILPFQISLFAALTITTVGMWFMNALIEKLISRNGERNFVGLNTNNWFIFRFLTDILLLNSPLITKGIPHLWPRNLPSTFLYFFWLIAQTILMWYISCYYNADASTNVYDKIETLADLERQNVVKPRLLKNGAEHRLLQSLVINDFSFNIELWFLSIAMRIIVLPILSLTSNSLTTLYNSEFQRVQADSNLLGKNLVDAMKLDEIYLKSLGEILDEELYTDVSKRKTVFLTRDNMLLFTSCYALQFLPNGKLELHFSNKPFLQVPISFMIYRNVSTDLQEIINQKLGALLESVPYEYLHLKCKYIVYSRNVWEKPQDTSSPLTLDILVVPSLILVSSCVAGFVISFGEHIYQAVTQPAPNKRRTFT